jgi:hypothetical protein
MASGVAVFAVSVMTASDEREDILASVSRDSQPSDRANSPRSIPQRLPAGMRDPQSAYFRGSATGVDPFRRGAREFVAHQVGQHFDLEAVCKHERFGGAHRSDAGQKAKRPALLVAQYRHGSCPSIDRPRQNVARFCEFRT